MKHFKLSKTFLFLTATGLFLSFLPTNVHAETSADPVLVKNVAGDDTEQFKLALQKSNHLLLQAGNPYIISEEIQTNQNVILETAPNSTGEKAVILKRNNNIHEYAFHFTNPAIATTKITENIKKGSNYVMVANASTLKPGQLLHLKSSKPWYWDPRTDTENLTKGELHKIKSVRGNKVYLEENTFEDYTVTGSTKNESITVTNHEDRTIAIKNVVFEHPVPTNKPFDTIMVRIDLSSNARINGLEVYGSRRAGLLLDRTYKTLVTNSTFDLRLYDDTIPSGYGIQDFGGLYNTMKSNKMTHVRRGIDFSGNTPSRFGHATLNTVIGPPKNTLSSGNSGIGTHSTAEDILIDYNRVEGFNYSFMSRGNRIKIQFNESSGLIRATVAAVYGDNLTIYKNTYQNPGSGNAENFIRIVKTFDGKITAQNNFSGVLVKDYVQNDSPNFHQLSLLNNRATFIQKSANPSYLIRSLEPISLTNSTLKENNMIMRLGDKAYVKNVNVKHSSNTVDYKQ